MCLGVGQALHAKLEELDAKDKKTFAATQLSPADQKIRDDFVAARAEDRQELDVKATLLSRRYDQPADRKDLLAELDNLDDATKSQSLRVSALEDIADLCLK